ncbi:MAG TPA: DUF1772 domain-containing protein [Vicinamibacterales bacterium]|nr:DUF1772 domain-containing protein [Vicinamibacterales bacterium]
MTFYTTALWFYSVMGSLILGAGVYESFVIHPAWSRKPPESFVGFVGSPVSRMNISAFWMAATPLYALSGLGALAVALWAGSREVPLVLSAVCAVSAVAWTVAYFRPTIHRFLDDGGGNTPAGRLQSEARRWTRLNWIRMALVAISWWGALTALATHV